MTFAESQRHLENASASAGSVPAAARPISLPAIKEMPTPVASPITTASLAAEKKKA
jgi:hypothetical protein